MEKYVLTQEAANQFKPLLISAPEDKAVDGRQYLEKLIQELNSLVEEWQSFWQEKPSVNDILSFLNSEVPGDFIKERYARIQRDGSGTLQQFTLDKVMELIEIPEYDALLQAYNRALITLRKLNRIDPFFVENLYRFWNGSEFYNNSKVMEDYENQTAYYTENIGENILLAIVLNLCESLETLNNIGLRLNKSMLGEKLAILIDARKEVYKGNIQFEFTPSHRIKKVAREKVVWDDNYKKLILSEVPNSFEVDDGFLLVGKNHGKVDEIISELKILVNKLNTLQNELKAFYGSDPSLDDMKKLIEANDEEYLLKTRYIEKNEVGIPEVKAKTDELIKIVDFPDHAGVLNTLEEIKGPLNKAKAGGISSIGQLYTPKGFTLTKEQEQEIEALHTYYTHGYFENIALCGLNQFAEALNELRIIGYAIPYTVLSFKLRRFLKLDKETGRVKVEPSIFEKEDIRIKIKGLQNEEYRQFVPKNFEIDFEDVDVVYSASFGST